MMVLNGFLPAKELLKIDPELAEKLGLDLSPSGPARQTTVSDA